MRFSERWLREWVNPDLSTEKLVDQLTLAGLELEQSSPVAFACTHVVVGKILHVIPHPQQQDRLRVCTVDVGSSTPLTIVTTLLDMKPEQLIAVAPPQAVLGDRVVEARDFHGVVSQGMFCADSDLGLQPSTHQLLELPSDARVGDDVMKLLYLEDQSIELSITPNRGDCLSVQGIAREVAALTKTALLNNDIKKYAAQHETTLPVYVHASDACPRYAGRIIRNVNPNARTPVWMKEYLRRSGIRSISPIVDVTQYVMLELGQPMHAFDLAKIHQGIHVRWAEKSESLVLLDERTVKLDENTLVIADYEKPLALAGIMGGSASGVTESTRDIFLESAHFSPQAIAGRARRYTAHTDSSHRFERGVDPELPRIALERATELLLEIVGGEPGPITEQALATSLPQRLEVSLNYQRLYSLLGFSLATEEVKNILQRLGFLLISETSEEAKFQVPSWRFDVTRQQDLIEEVARIYGYDHIPTVLPSSELHVSMNTLHATQTQRLTDLLMAQGYSEVITYSFIDQPLQQLFDPETEALVLSNPISNDLSHMRTSLWPGLINVLRHNQARQQSRVRIFEIGARFLKTEEDIRQQKVLAGLVNAPLYPEQWDIKVKQHALDFYHVKQDVLNLLSLNHAIKDVTFEAAEHPALHPGQTAKIFRQKRLIGWLGCIHPSISQKLDIDENIFLFELNVEELTKIRVPTFTDISKYPAIRRDISFLVRDNVSYQQLREAIYQRSHNILREVFVFDIYSGTGVPERHKSMAFAFIWQHEARTLLDEEINEAMQEIVSHLQKTFHIVLRDGTTG